MRGCNQVHLICADTVRANSRQLTRMLEHPRGEPGARTNPQNFCAVKSRNQFVFIHASLFRSYLNTGAGEVSNSMRMNIFEEKSFH